VTQVSFGAANFRWHARGTNASPDLVGPPTTITVPAWPGTLYMLPRASITVLRGAVT